MNDLLAYIQEPEYPADRELNLREFREVLALDIDLVPDKQVLFQKMQAVVRSLGILPAGIPDSMPDILHELTAVKPVCLRDIQTLALSMTKDNPIEELLNWAMQPEDPATVVAGIKKLVEHFGADAVRAADTKARLLSKVASSGSMELLEVAKPLLRSDVSFPIISAIRQDNPVFFRAFMDLCIGLDKKRFAEALAEVGSCNSPVAFAIMSRHTAIVKELVTFLAAEYPEILSRCFTDAYNGRTPLHHAFATGNEELNRFFVEIRDTLSEDALRAALAADSTGLTLVHFAAKDSSHALKLLIETLGVETVKDMARSWTTAGGGSGRFAYELALLYGPEENAAITRSFLSPEDRAQLCDPKATDGSLLHRVVASHKLAEVRRIVSCLTPEEIASSLGPDSKGRTLLHTAIRSRCLATVRFIAALYPEDRLASTMVPDQDGWTPFHSATLYCSDLGIDFVAELTQRTGAISMELASRLDIYGRSALSLLASLPEANAASFHAAANALRSFGSTCLEESMKPDSWGMTPLHWACYEGASSDRASEVLELIKPMDPKIIRQCMGQATEGTPMQLLARQGNTQAIETMLEVAMRAGEEAVLESLKPNRGGTTVLTELPAGQAYGWLRRRFMDFLKTKEELASALCLPHSDILDQSDVIAYLMERFPAEKDRLDILLWARFLSGKRLVPYAAGAYRLISQDTAQTCVTLDDPGCADLCYIHPRLTGRLAKMVFDLRKKVDAEKDPDRRKELVKRAEKLMQWQVDITIALQLSGASAENIDTLLPLILRLQNLADDGERQRITHMIARWQLGDDASTAVLKAWMEKVGGKNAPALYLWTLAAMQKREAPLAGVQADPKRALKLSSKHSEAGSRGKRFLRFLNRVYSSDLTTAEIDALLEKAVHSPNPTDCIIAAGQLIGLGATDRLQAEGLAPGSDLKALAQEEFKELLSLSDMENFEALYSKYISSQRDPDALLDYVSSIRRYPETLKDLGTYLRAVLSGPSGMLMWRHAPERSEHLAALYKARPDLNWRLQALPRMIQETRVESLHGEPAPLRCPLGMAEVRDKVMEDKMLDHQRFKHLVDFFETGEIAAELEDSTDLDLCFQKQLITLCTATDYETQRSAVMTAMKFAVSLAHTKPIGFFINILDIAARQILDAEKDRHEARSRVADFRVSVTDHYWDFLRIGTDVQGSCQHLTNSAGMHRCLLGYGMNGYVSAIVVKKPCSPVIQARRLLFVTLDQHGQPALFLERLYSNYSEAEVDAAIISKAKDVARELKLPLYSLSAHDPNAQASDAVLSVGKGAAHWCYSDASQGPVRGPFNIDQPQLLWGVSSAASSSGSRASSSSAAP